MCIGFISLQVVCMLPAWDQGYVSHFLVMPYRNIRARAQLVWYTVIQAWGQKSLELVQSKFASLTVEVITGIHWSSTSVVQHDRFLSLIYFSGIQIFLFKTHSWRDMLCNYLTWFCPRILNILTVREVFFTTRFLPFLLVFRFLRFPVFFLVPVPVFFFLLVFRFLFLFVGVFFTGDFFTGFDFGTPQSAVDEPPAKLASASSTAYNTF